MTTVSQEALGAARAHHMDLKRRVSVGIVLILLAGLLVRAVLAVRWAPMLGDPTYSYCYRALLISHGRWAGVFLMWHPPGYPLLLAGSTFLSAHFLSPYLAGCLVSLACCAVLVLIVDRLASPCIRNQETRLAIASFLVFQEVLLVYQAGPLTEPLYLVLIYGSLWLVAEREQPWRVGCAGVLAGFAITVRLEAFAPIFGIILGLLVIATPGRPGSAAALQRLCRVALFAGGALLASSWMLVNTAYLARCHAIQELSYTIPPVSGAAANLKRFIACGYYVLTVWLPTILLLPFWCVCAAALWTPPPSLQARRIHFWLLCVVVPSFLAVGVTITHKRTGTFMLPACAIWFGIGVEALGARLTKDVRNHTALRWTVAVAVSANVLQAARVLPYALHQPARAIPIEAQMVSRHARNQPLWGFGSEPELYALSTSDAPPVYDFFGSSDNFEAVYGAHRRDPGAFVDQLRKRGFKALMVTIPNTNFVSADPKGTRSDQAMPKGLQDNSQAAEEPDANSPPQPLESDMAALVAAPAQYRLELAEAATVPNGKAYLMLIK